MQITKDEALLAVSRLTSCISPVYRLPLATGIAIGGVIASDNPDRAHRIINSLFPLASPADQRNFEKVYGDPSTTFVGEFANAFSERATKTVEAIKTAYEQRTATGKETTMDAQAVMQQAQREI